MELMAQPVLVASIDDVLVTRLLALSEQEPDFRGVLELARSLREQIDRGKFVRERTTRLRSPPPSSHSSRRARIAPGRAGLRLTTRFSAVMFVISSAMIALGSLPNRNRSAHRITRQLERVSDRRDSPGSGAGRFRSAPSTRPAVLRSPGLSC